MQIANLSLALSIVAGPHVALSYKHYTTRGNTLHTNTRYLYMYVCVEKPNGDVTGGSNKYDYRPSSTLANQRRKYPVPLIIFVHLFNQK